MSDAEDCSWDGYVDRLRGHGMRGTPHDDEEEEVWAQDEKAPRLPHQLPQEVEKDDEDWLLCGDNFLEQNSKPRGAGLRRFLKLGVRQGIKSFKLTYNYFYKWKSY